MLPDNGVCVQSGALPWEHLEQVAVNQENVSSGAGEPSASGDGRLQPSGFTPAP
jgi:hypothetical protein